MSEFFQNIALKKPRNAARLFGLFPEQYWVKKGHEFKTALLHETIKSVPAYKHHLDKNKYKIGDTGQEWENIPQVDKQSYLQAYPMPDLLNGSIEDVYAWSTSSGYANKPFYWPRSKEQERLTAKITEVLLTTFFEIDQVPTLIIDGFSLGNWITGELIGAITRSIAQQANYPLSLITPGSDIEEILRNIRDLGLQYKQIILFGYPPMIRRIIDLGSENNIQWSKYNIKVVVTGEPYSEEWRTYIRAKLGVAASKMMDVMGFYGAADAGLMGIETPLTMLIRTLMGESPEFCRALTGETRVPSLVQYNPAIKYIEQAANQELLITSNGYLPLIRYNIHDQGGVLSFSQMMELLEQHGFDERLKRSLGISKKMHALWRWPFCFIFGRTDGTVSVDGANIYPSEIEHILLADENAALVESFKLHIKDGDKGVAKLHISIQMTSDAAAIFDQGKHEALADHFQKRIAQDLVSLNADFAKTYHDHPSAAQPVVEIMRFGEGIFASERGAIKHHYVG